MDFAKLKREKSILEISVEGSQVRGDMGSSHEICPTGASKILGSLLQSFEEKYKRSVMEGRRNGKESSSQVCVWWVEDVMDWEGLPGGGDI